MTKWFCNAIEAAMRISVFARQKEHARQQAATFFDINKYQAEKLIELNKRIEIRLERARSPARTQQTQNL